MKTTTDKMRTKKDVENFEQAMRECGVKSTLSHNDFAVTYCAVIVADHSRGNVFAYIGKDKNGIAIYKMSFPC